MKDEYGCERGELSRRVHHLEKENAELREANEKLCNDFASLAHARSQDIMWEKPCEDNLIKELRRENERLRELHRCDHNGKLNQENLRLNDENYKLGVEIHELRAKLENARIALGPK